MKMILSLAHCEALSYLKGFADKSVDLIITDPPYGVLDPELCNWEKGNIDWEILGNEMFRILKPNGQIFMYSSWQLWFHLMSLPRWRKSFYYEIIFNRKATFAAPYKKRPANVHEYGLVFRASAKPVYFDPAPLGVKKDSYHRQNLKTGNLTSDLDSRGIYSRSSGLRKPITVIPTRRKSNLEKKWRTDHPTQKDHITMRNIIDTLSPPGSIIVDPFFGSGTVFIAALLAKYERRVFGCEINEQYYRAAMARLKGLHFERNYTSC